LSRTPHAALDVAAPALAALLWLDGLPPWRITLLGLLTAFAAYLAVYALNDIAGCPSDREKIRSAPSGRNGCQEAADYLDSALVRHPLALGLLNKRQAVAWTAFWAGVAIVGAAVLNPVCLLIFLGGCAAEAAYCRLWCVTPLRALLSGVVKTLGPLAAVFAVDPRPPALPLALLFLWVFLVEIGGQNIPADWTDIKEDRCLGAETIPVLLGERRAARLVLLSLALGVLAQQALVWVLAGSHSLYVAGYSLAAGFGLLLLPALRLQAALDRHSVIRLFNRASFYPAALLAGAAVKLLF
jgi:4-hydroxybenzoate polyprenyltransferase